jgi:hypothetical protein
MANDNSEQQTLAQSMGIPETIRWMDLSAYSMSLKLAIYKNGSGLVIQGGDRQSDAITKLGFRKVDGEWVSGETALDARKTISVLPDANVGVAQAYEMLLDRREQLAPEKVPSADPVLLSVYGRTFGEKVAAAVASSPSAPLVQHPKFYFAVADISGFDAHGFGATPEAAMQSLVASWSALESREDGNISDLSEFRESISVRSAEMGKGYAKGVGDTGWYKDVILGSDERFDATFEEYSRPVRTVATGPRP